MAEFDVDEFINRFQERARAVKARGLPPVAGPDRAALIAQAERDYMDFALVGAASWTVDGDSLVLRVPLKP